MSAVYQHAAARRDLVEQFVYIAEEAGLDRAERFLASAEASFYDLARACCMRHGIGGAYWGLKPSKGWGILA